MMKKRIAAICTVTILLACVAMSADALLTNLIENTNLVCKRQKFSSAEEAVQAMEIIEREDNDISLDVCPPYKLVYSFDYDENIIIFFSYCEEFDGEQSPEYAVRILKKNSDGTLSFDSGFAYFKLTVPGGNENYYYFTNIETSNGKKSASFLYLPKDSDKDIYVDGIKTEKMLVSMEESELYICYAISKPDTFFSNFSTEISERHKIEIK